jgi:hypothetical protein
MHDTDQVHCLPSAPNDDVKTLVAGNNAFAYDLYQALRDGKDSLSIPPSVSPRRWPWSTPEPADRRLSR